METQLAMAKYQKMRINSKLVGKRVRSIDKAKSFLGQEHKQNHGSVQ